MKRILLISAAAFAASSLAAQAADLPLRGSVPAFEAPVAGFVWTGAYVGVNAGYAFDNQHDYHVVGSPPGLTGGAPMSLRTKSDGFTGGGQVGYNYQMDGAGLGALTGFGGPASLVLGAEADIAYTDLDSKGSSVGAGFVSRYSSRTDYIGTVRGRVGVAFGPMLVYGTGGFAYGGVKNRVSDFNNSGLPLFAGARDSIRTGYAYGGGVEYAIPTTSFVNVFNAGAITARAEFIHYDLGTDSFAVTGNAAAGTGGLRYTAYDRYAGNLVRVGLNYRFGTVGAAPVIARY